MLTEKNNSISLFDIVYYFEAYKKEGIDRRNENATRDISTFKLYDHVNESRSEGGEEAIQHDF